MHARKKTPMQNGACFAPLIGVKTTLTRQLSIDKVNLLQMDKLNNLVDVHQKPTLNGTLNGTSLKYLNMV